jgi:hypothetical protein
MSARLREAAQKLRRAMLDLADSLEAGPEGDAAAPVVAWLAVTPSGCKSPTVWDPRPHVEWGMMPANSVAYPLIRQFDHIAAIAARDAEIANLQRQIGECSGGYQTLELEVASLKNEVAIFEGHARLEDIGDRLDAAARQQAPEAAIMHKPSGFIFDTVIAAARPNDLVSLTTTAADAEAQIQAHMALVRSIPDVLYRYTTGSEDYEALIESIVASARRLQGRDK